MKLNNSLNNNFRLRKLLISVSFISIICVLFCSSLSMSKRNSRKTKKNLIKDDPLPQMCKSMNNDNSCSTYDCKNGKAIKSKNMSYAEAEIPLNYLNRMRTKINLQSTRAGKALKKGGDLLKLYWSNTLQTNSFNYSKCCPALKFPHSTNDFRKDKSGRGEGIAGEIVYFEKITKDMIKTEAEKFSFENSFDKIEKQALKGLELSTPEANQKAKAINNIIKSYDPQAVNNLKQNFLADYLQLVNSKSYRVGCGMTVCEYAAENYYKVYVCLFNKGLIEGSSVYRKKIHNEIKNQINVDQTSQLLIPKGYESKSHLDKPFVIKFPVEKKTVKSNGH